MPQRREHFVEAETPGVVLLDRPRAPALPACGLGQVGERACHAHASHVVGSIAAIAFTAMEQHPFGIHRAEDPPGSAGRPRLEWKVAEMPQARPLICHCSTAPLRRLDAGERREAPLMLELPGLAVALRVHE